MVRVHVGGARISSQVFGKVGRGGHLDSDSFARETPSRAPRIHTASSTHAIQDISTNDTTGEMITSILYSYRTAMLLHGLATPSGIWSGAEVKRNEYPFCFFPLCCQCRIGEFSYRKILKLIVPYPGSEAFCLSYADEVVFSWTMPEAQLCISLIMRTSSETPKPASSKDQDATCGYRSPLSTETLRPKSSVTRNPVFASNFLPGIRTMHERRRAHHGLRSLRLESRLMMFR